MPVVENTEPGDSGASWGSLGLCVEAPGRGVINGPQKTKRQVSSTPPPAGRNLKDH